MKKSKIMLGMLIGVGFATFAFADNAEASQTMHRLYNPNSGEHFYTANVSEKNHLSKVGWKYEGTGWVAPDTGADVYRLYNPNAGDHHYTMNLGEKNNLVKLGWKYEGVGWKSDNYKGVKLYRAYNPNAKAGSHNYTTNNAEQKNLIRVGWRDEGLAWYGMNPNQKFNIKVVHKGSDGKVLHQQIVGVKRDTNYKASAKSFSGYTLKGSNTQTVKADGNKTITFNYTKNPAPVVQKYNVTVVHKSSDGKVLETEKAVQVEKGKQYTGKAKNFSGYTLNGNSTQTVTVNGNTTITFTYKKNPEPAQKFTVSVQYKVDGGKLVTGTIDKFEVEKGKEFTATAKTFEGYTLKGSSTQTVTVNSDMTITFTYTKNETPVEKFNVTIKYQDTDVDVLETARGIQVEKGKQYTATAKTFEGYTLQGSNTQTVTINDHTTITFNYKKNVVEDLQTIESQLNNQALANINSHRSKNGKASIKLNSILQQASTIRSRELAVKFDHTRPNGSDSSTVAEGLGYDKLHWNENIYMGSGMSLDWIKSNGAQLIVNAWINSSGHNATLLSDEDIEGAVGVYIKDNGNGKYNLYASYLPGEPLFSSRNADVQKVTEEDIRIEKSSNPE